jgi:hypothetical protein
VASLLGIGDLALACARRALATADTERWTGWRLASSHEGMARASAACGDANGRRRHLEAAREALADEPDDDDRRVIEEQIASIPEI